MMHRQLALVPVGRAWLTVDLPRTEAESNLNYSSRLNPSPVLSLSLGRGKGNLHKEFARELMLRAALFGMERSGPTLSDFLIKGRLPDANQTLFKLPSGTGLLRNIGPESDTCFAAQS